MHEAKQDKVAIKHRCKPSYTQRWLANVMVEEAATGSDTTQSRAYRT